jgi:tetratricopeptide (TPR) repeat protein
MLAEGGASGILHLCLGIDALGKAEMATARQHFDLAFKLMPNMPVVANNLAMSLTVGEKADPERALGIIQPLLERFPNVAAYRDTRGRVLVKLGRYQDAISDLEFALPELGATPSAHIALAEAYRGIGMSELAGEHERLAKGAPKR